MTSTAARSTIGRLTPRSLRSDARPLHQPRVLIWNVGWLSVCAALALSVIGIAAIATIPPESGQTNFALRHVIHLFVALLGAAIVAVPHFQILQRLSYPLLILVLLLLVFVMIPWVPEAIVKPRNGARRWINLVVTDFQPSEIAKLAYVLAMASYLRYRDSFRTFSGLIWLLLLTFVPLGLVLIEPDLGTALLFLPTLFAMIIAAGAKLRHILIVVVLGLSIAPAMYPFLRPHQKDRIHAMWAQIRGDDRYQNDIGYQGARAMTLVGAGGWFGNGREHAASLVHFNKLPEEHNDMIFAVICCRWGVLGALTTWGAFALLFLGGLLAAGQTKDPFARLVAVGIVAILFAQMLINTGMVIGVLPITGLTLPFVSYGGSSMVSAWLMVGVILNIAMRRPRWLARRSFEFDHADETA